MDLSSHDCAPSRSPVNDWRRMDSVAISTEVEAKTFKSKTKTFNDYFNSDKEFIIPAFQREYSWSKENVIKLINDAMNQKDRVHFIGAFIVTEQGSNKLIIIDGQQRLTSILLILCAIRDCKYNKIYKGKLIKEEEFEKIEKYVYGRMEDNNLNDELTEARDILFAGSKRREFEGLFSKNKKFGTMLTTYREIYDFISMKGDKYIHDLYHSVLNLTFTEISSSRVLDAYYVFRALNSSGVSLKLNDHVKAHIFSHLDAGSYEDSQKVAVDKSFINKWNEIKTNVEYKFDKNSIVKFMENFALVNRIGSGPLRNVHEWYFSYVDEGGKAQDVLEIMREDSKIYHNIVDPDINDTSKGLKFVRSNLKFLQDISIKQHVRLMYAACKLNEKGVMTNKQLRDLTEFLAKFHFIYSLPKEPTNKLTGIYKNYSEEFIKILNEGATKENSVKDVIDLLKNDFKDLFAAKSSIFENAKKEFCMLNLEEGNKRKRGNESIIGYILHSCFPKVWCEGEETFEHIVPQSTGRKNVENIGNLIFLTKLHNEAVKAFSLSKKREKYKDFKYLPQEFMEIINEYASDIDDDGKFDEFRMKMAHKMFAMFASDLGYEDPDEYRGATPQNSARNVPKPGKRYEHYEETTEGLRLMIDGWLYAYNYGIQTGNFSYAKEYFSPDIEEFDCQEIEALYKRGGWVINGLYSYKVEDKLPKIGESGIYKVKTNVTREHVLYCEPDKTPPAQENKHTVDLIFVCKYDNGYWNVLDVENG